MKRNMTLMDVVASETLAFLGRDVHTRVRAVRAASEFGSREVVGIAWSFARFVLHHETLLEALAQRFLSDHSGGSTPRDLATMA